VILGGWVFLMSEVPLYHTVDYGPFINSHLDYMQCTLEPCVLRF